MWSDELARGRAVFVDDMTPIKDELVAVLVQSKFAHAEIVDVDFSEALKVPGKVLFSRW
jgi:xanthine dehydrogenase molybdopterin-binding subunit B